MIRAWDPYDLIAGGAPANEFDDQVARITAKVPSFYGIDEIAQTISDVFSASFGPGTLAPVDCFRPAQEIFMELRRAKLLPAA
ncbi:hypothetical protein ASD53_09680 [Lysobacter sp. Root559]|nr:hypothetical protein ASD53_09680 [Lysobacter sp. Root559]